MIGFVEGTLAEREPGRVVVSVGGVGYELHVSATTLSTLPATGRRARVLTHLQVKDDGLVLYGFAHTDERDLFRLLVGVSGVGPKLALQILSTLDPAALRRAVLDGDPDAITLVPGIGKKGAAKIVLELKERLSGEVDMPEAGGPLAEVRAALEQMGLSAPEIREATANLEADGQATEELLKKALRQVSAR